MLVKIQALVVAAALWLSVAAVAHDDGILFGITDDGRRIQLNQDHTWDFMDLPKGDPATSAVLTILEVTDLGEACNLKVHMKNNLPMRIGHLVPRFNIYNQDGVLFDTVSKSFANMKPGKEQYSSMQFSGIGCSDIKFAHLFSASRCRMKDIDIWNEKEGECLSRLYVTPTDLINLSK